MTTPYWRPLPDAARYAFDADAPFGLPYRPTPFTATIELTIGGAAVTVQQPVEYRYEGNIFSGEKRTELLVVPRFSVSVTPEIAIVPAAPIPTAAGKGGAPTLAERELRVIVVNGNKGAAKGEVSLSLPAGWSATPATAPVTFAREDAAETVRFTVKPAAGAKSGQYDVKAVVRDGAESFDQGYQVIEYPHIRRQHLVLPARAAIKVIDVKVAPKLKVGYVMGVGDQVPQAIAQLGAQVDLLDADALAWGNLGQYDAIVTGVRAYERRADLRANNRRLIAYAENGGTLIVQYNKMEFNETQYGPFPGEGQLEPRDRRDRAGRGAGSDQPDLHVPERDWRRDVEGLGAGARPVLPGREGRELRRPGAAAGSVSCEQRHEEGRTGRGEGWQGSVDLRRPRAVAAVAGRHRRRVSIAGEPDQRRQSPAEVVVDSSDVLVVGAGPAGSTAARALALGGARVRLLERARFPRNKPCGGGLTTRALKRFPHLATVLERVEGHYISRLYLEGPAHRGVVLTSPTPAVVTIRRTDFDQALAQLAAESGAELVEGAVVSTVSADADGARVTTRDGREFRADYLVAADGVNGIVARRLGLNPGWEDATLALDVMEESPNERLRALDPDTLWVSYGQGGAAGYGYIFPKSGHTNVGIGCLRSSLRGGVALPPDEMQQRFVAGLRQRGLVEGRANREDFTPCHLPLGGPIPTTARGRVLVAGDAGGFVNAYTGEGIFYAMVTGELAARAILEDAALDDPRRGTTAARTYVGAWRREIGGELRDSVLIQKYLFRDPVRIDRVVAGAGVHRAVGEAIIAYARGALSYREARRFLIRRFPRALFRLLKSLPE